MCNKVFFKVFLSNNNGYINGDKYKAIYEVIKVDFKWKTK